MIAEKQNGTGKTVKATITYADGTAQDMEFEGWKAYTDFIEQHYGEISEASGVI